MAQASNSAAPALHFTRLIGHLSYSLRSFPPRQVNVAFSFDSPGDRTLHPIKSGKQGVFFPPSLVRKKSSFFAPLPLPEIGHSVKMENYFVLIAQLFHRPLLRARARAIKVVNE